MGNSVVHILPTDISLPELPEAFCKFFSDKIKDIRCELDSCPIDNDFIPFDGIPLTCFRPVLEETVRDLVLKSPTKSCALDPIPTGLLKACIDSLAHLIARIVNEYLESGTVRDVLKQAIVTPLLKKPSLDSNMLKNYRPVHNYKNTSVGMVCLRPVSLHTGKNTAQKQHCLLSLTTFFLTLTTGSHP